MKHLLSALLLLFPVRIAHCAQAEQIVSQWLAHQTNIQTWSAAFSQTRTLKGLAQPLVSTGQVWFAAPQNFRWELGRDHTIAIRNGDDMLVAYPRLQRVEKYSFSSNTRSEWKDALALLQSGFPRSRSELDQQFTILGVAQTNSLLQLNLQPKSPGARKMMPQINILLTTNLNLAGTELQFVDGSKMRNEFTAVQTNINVTGKFEFEIPRHFNVVEPMKGKK